MLDERALSRHEYLVRLIALASLSFGNSRTLLTSISFPLLKPIYRHDILGLPHQSSPLHRSAESWCGLSHRNIPGREHWRMTVSAVLTSGTLSTLCEWSLPACYHHWLGGDRWTWQAQRDGPAWVKRYS